MFQNKNHLLRAFLCAATIFATGCFGTEEPIGEDLRAALGAGECGDRNGPIVDDSGEQLGTFQLDYVDDDLIVTVTSLSPLNLVLDVFLHVGSSLPDSGPNQFAYSVEGRGNEASIAVPLAELGEDASCPSLYVAIYAEIGFLRRSGWAEGPIALGQPHNGMALETSCCSEEPDPPSEPTSPGDTDTNDQLGPLYQGSGATQLEVEQGAIDTVRTSAIRGSVKRRGGGPLEGVRVSIHERPEFGYTKTGPSGKYTMVVSGGERYTVDFADAGYLSAQRSVEPVWGEIAWTKDVALVPSVAPSTTVQALASAVQEVIGARETDSDGARRPLVLIPTGTAITLEGANGTDTQLSNADISVVEFTVGDDGPAAMPGELPQATAYTYAAAFRVAQAGPDDIVRFSNSVSVYLENFLGFPIGGKVPVGFYDRDLGAWSAEPNGIVVKIVGASGFGPQLAAIDITGDGVADSSMVLAAIGLTEEERAKLLEHYNVGDELWRAQLEHFSTYDLNPGGQPTADARHPNNRPYYDDLDDGPCLQSGSIIECNNQALRETIGVTGTSIALHYSSAHVHGRLDTRTLVIPLTGDDPPPNCSEVITTIDIAGRRFEQSHSCTANQSMTFTWDGNNAWGRRLQGKQIATVRIGFRYPVVYSNTGYTFGTAATLGWPLVDGNIRLTKDGASFIFSRLSRRWIGGLSNLPDNSIGGWTLSSVHRRDRGGRRIYFGDGTRQTVPKEKLSVSRPYSEAVHNDEGEGAMVASPDGSLFFSSGTQVFRRNRDGSVELFAGSNAGGRPCSGDTSDPLSYGFGFKSANGGTLRGIDDMELGPDGSLYVLSAGRLARIFPQGNVGLIGSELDICGAIPAGVVELTPIGTPEAFRGLAIDSQSNVFLWHGIGVEQISETGTIRDIDFKCAAGVIRVADLVIDSQDQLILSCFDKILRRSPTGLIDQLAGGGTGAEGGPAVDAKVEPRALAIDGDDNIFFVNSAPGTVSQRIMVIRDGVLHAVAGNLNAAHGGFDDTDPGPFTTSFRSVRELAPSPSGHLWTLETMDDAIRQVGVAGLDEIDITLENINFEAVPDSSGSALYLFDGSNRHRKTIDATTGRLLMEMAYNDENQLTSITDGDNNELVIVRGADGRATRLIAPFGQETVLQYDSEGYLSRVINPEGHQVSPTHDQNGLLTHLADPLGRLHRYTYDPRGRLINDDMPLGEKTLTKQLSNLRSYPRREVSLETELGRTTRYITEALHYTLCPGGTTGECSRFRVVDPDGQETSTYGFRDGSTVVELGDGSTMKVGVAEDPRFGKTAEYVSSLELSLPGGRTLSAAHEIRATLLDPNDPLSITELSRISNIQGNNWATVFDVAEHRVSQSTPEGRGYVATLDADDRLVREEVVGVLPVDYEYDARGRLIRIRQGEREVEYGFDQSSGFLDRVAALRDQAGGASDFETVLFTRDQIGRVTEQTQSDGSTVGLNYDAASNITAMNASGALHSFSYNPIDQAAGYVPPNLGDGQSRSESQDYNADGDLVTEVLADGTQFTATYNSAGQLTSLAASDGSIVNIDYQSSGLRQTSSVSESGGGRPTTSLEFSNDGPDISEVAVREEGTLIGAVSFDNTEFFDNQRIVESATGVSDVVYQFDRDELLIGAGPITIARDPFNGRPVSRSVDALTSTYSYEPHGDLDGQISSVAGAELYRFDLAFDRLARISSESSVVDGGSSTRNYVYDDRSRLIEVRDSSGVLQEQYVYDGRDNRVAVLGIAGAQILFDSQDQLLQQGGATYGYNLRGDQTIRVDSAGTTAYNYDPSSQLVGVTLANGSVVTYVNDPSGSRIGRVLNGVRTDTYLPGPAGQTAMHLDGASGVRTRFIYARTSSVPSAFERDGQRYGLIFDTRGSVRLVIRTSDGAILQRLDYDAYGRVTSDSNPGFQPFGFGGGIYDSEVGLVRFGARTYDPETGRFLQRDPEGFPDGPNRYIYVGGDPVNRIDPSGLAWYEDLGNMAAGFGDAVTFGATRKVRQWLDVDDVVDKCSGWYKAGGKIDEYGGYLTGVGVARNLAKAGLKRAVKTAKRRLRKPCKSSFAAGTLVATPTGDQPIETIEVGDEVICKSEITGLETSCRVADTFGRTAPQTLEITLTDPSSGTSELIRTTSEHPFFTGSFTAAAHLRPGDTVLAEGDRHLVVQSTTWAPSAQVFNFEVENNHTYFVGQLATWVHNCPKGDPPRSTLPRDRNGNFLPDTRATGPHTTIGVRRGRRGSYRQGATFDSDGTFKGVTDLTDHGRGHPTPHFHPALGANRIKHGPHPIPEL